MAAFSLVARLDKDQPAVRLVPDVAGTGTNLIDFWDETSRRYKSGIVNLTVDSVTLSDANVGPSGGLYYSTGGGATYTTGETLALSIQPPNYNPVTDTQFLNSGIQVASGALGYAKAYNSAGSIYQNYCPLNYGRPGPSAMLGADGTIQYTAIDLALASNAFTDITSKFTVTVAGTITQTIISPYADIGSTGGGSYSLLLCAGPLASKKYLPAGYQGQGGFISFPTLTKDATGFASVAVQIQKITTSYYPGPTPDYQAPVLQISNPMGQSGAQPVANWNFPIPMVGQQVNTLSDNWTVVNVANFGLVSANGFQMGSSDVGVSGSAAYNLLNAMIQMPPNSGCSVGVKIDYKIAKAT